MRVPTREPSQARRDGCAAHELLRQLSLYSATRVDRAVLPVTEYGELGEDGILGTVTVKVVSSAKEVLIDGIRFSYDDEGGWAQGAPTPTAGKQRSWGGLRGSNP